MHIKTLVAAIACTFAAFAASAGSLDTNLSTNNSGRQGMYFTLTAANAAVTLDSFVVDGQPGTWGIWYKTGTYSGFETDPSAWTELGTGTTSSTIDTLAVGGLTIGANQTDALYIFDESGPQSYSDGVFTYANADLSFTGGTGNYGLFDNTLDFRNWSGTINYSLTSAVPEPTETALMLAGLVLVGAAVRRRRQA